MSDADAEWESEEEWRGSTGELPSDGSALSADAERLIRKAPPPDAWRSYAPTSHVEAFAMASDRFSRVPRGWLFAAGCADRILREHGISAAMWWKDHTGRLICTADPFLSGQPPTAAAGWQLVGRWMSRSANLCEACGAAGARRHEVRVEGHAPVIYRICEPCLIVGVDRGWTWGEIPRWFDPRGR